MSRDITVTFGDGTSHVYRNAPDDVTPDQVQQRAEQEFSKSVVSLDGGRRIVASDPTEGMSGLGKFVAGYGQGVTEIGRGLGQTLGFRDYADTTEARRQDAPLMATGAGRAGSIAGQVLTTAPLMAIPGANTLLGASLIGAGMGLTAPSESGTETATNTAFGAAAAPVLSGAMRSAGWVWDKVGGRAVQVKAGKIVREIAGPKLAQIQAALANAKAGETAGQTVQGAKIDAPTFQALEEFASKKLPYNFRDIQNAQETARRQGLAAVTPDVAKAEAARDAASGALYEAADAATTKVPLTAAKDSAGRPLLDRPVMREVISAAEENAANKGIQMYDSAGNLTGKGAHLIKIKLDEASGAIARNTGAASDIDAIRTAKGEYLDWLKTQIPEYDKARAAFAANSPPVDQGHLLDGVMKLSVNNLTGGERAGAMVNALTTGAANLMKRSGIPRYAGTDPMAILNVPQARAVNKYLFELPRDARMEQMASEGSNQLTKILNLPKVTDAAPTFFGVGYSALKKVLDAMSGRMNEKTLNRLAVDMQSGKSILELINTVPTSQRPAFLKALQQANMGSIPASATLNALTGGGVQ